MKTGPGEIQWGGKIMYLCCSTNLFSLILFWIKVRVMRPQTAAGVQLTGDSCSGIIFNCGDNNILC